jgi:hypothetical protein
LGNAPLASFKEGFDVTLVAPCATPPPVLNSPVVMNPGSAPLAFRSVSTRMSSTPFSASLSAPGNSANAAITSLISPSEFSKVRYTIRGGDII